MNADPNRKGYAEGKGLLFRIVAGLSRQWSLIRHGEGVLFWPLLLLTLSVASALFWTGLPVFQHWWDVHVNHWSPPR